MIVIKFKLILLAIVLIGYVEYSLGGCGVECFNGGTCVNTTCNCTDGWYGKKCHRPCQDVFKSCARWKEEGRCDWDDQTKYFDDHCPHTCDNCVYDNKTIVQFPLAPLLEPIQSFIGTWRCESTTPDHFPVDFASGGYDEEIRIMATDVPAFDRPTLNYSAKAISKVDSNDIQHDYGFLYVKPSKNSSTLIGIMTTDNNGITLVQEGYMNGNEIKFSTIFNSSLPNIKLNQVHLDSARILELFSADQLGVTIRNQDQSYSKYYRKV